MFLIAIILSLIIKNPGEDEDDEEITEDEEKTRLASDEIPLHSMNPDSKLFRRSLSVAGILNTNI